MEKYLEVPVELIILRLGTQRPISCPHTNGHDFVAKFNHPQRGAPLVIKGFNRSSEDPLKAVQVLERIYDSNTYRLGSVS